MFNVFTTNSVLEIASIDQPTMRNLGRLGIAQTCLPPAFGGRCSRRETSFMVVGRVGLEPTTR